jgi:hypothetical protein
MNRDRLNQISLLRFLPRYRIRRVSVCCKIELSSIEIVIMVGIDEAANGERIT